jgi:hypothetical protein
MQREKTGEKGAPLKEFRLKFGLKTSLGRIKSFRQGQKRDGKKIEGKRAIINRDTKIHGLRLVLFNGAQGARIGGVQVVEHEVLFRRICFCEPHSAFILHTNIKLKSSWLVLSVMENKNKNSRKIMQNPHTSCNLPLQECD